MRLMKIIRKTKNNKEMHSNVILKGPFLYSSIWPILREVLSPLNKGGKGGTAIQVIQTRQLVQD